ncbi:MAG: dephospho-CoA kinase [Candidatus Nanohaloarchaea archaeon]|jgi:dephospho-CoA kinase
MTQLYGVAGLPLSGKTTVAGKMQQNGFKKVDMGDVVREEMDKRGVPAEETGDFVSALRKQNGMAAIAELTLPYVEEVLQENEKVVISGMRSWMEKECFEKNLSEQLNIIAVWASRETRFERQEGRGREEDQVVKLEERDEREIEHGAAKLITLADYLLVNEFDSLEGFEQEVENALQELEVK